MLLKGNVRLTLPTFNHDLLYLELVIRRKFSRYCTRHYVSIPALTDKVIFIVHTTIYIFTGCNIISRKIGLIQERSGFEMVRNSGDKDNELNTHQLVDGPPSVVT